MRPIGHAGTPIVLECTMCADVRANWLENRLCGWQGDQFRPEGQIINTYKRLPYTPMAELTKQFVGTRPIGHMVLHFGFPCHGLEELMLGVPENNLVHLGRRNLMTGCFYLVRGEVFIASSNEIMRGLVYEE
jgi:hypothetical protein